jgi:hypothetical protein
VQIQKIVYPAGAIVSLPDFIAGELIAQGLVEPVVK